MVEVRNSKGDVIYSHDRDAPPPVQVEPADKVVQMVSLMNQVVQSGTGRAAQLDGITVAGKTGTTNSSRDAWFIGYTGNYVASVWFGNDDFSPMNGMTGGTLPAQTWHNIMAYAHQGVELEAAAWICCSARTGQSRRQFSWQRRPRRSASPDYSLA